MCTSSHHSCPMLMSQSQPKPLRSLQAQWGGPSKLSTVRFHGWAVPGWQHGQRTAYGSHAGAIPTHASQLRPHAPPCGHLATQPASQTTPFTMHQHSHPSRRWWRVHSSTANAASSSAGLPFNNEPEFPPSDVSAAPLPDNGPLPSPATSDSTSTSTSTSKTTSITTHVPTSSVISKIVQFVDQQCLPLMLVTMICVGLAAPAWGLAASKAGLSQTVTFSIFIIAGLQLRRGEATQALQAWGCVVWGLASILVFTPLLGIVLRSLPGDAGTQAVLMGLAVFSAVPTTLSSGITMTTTAGGNTALAILLTVASNLLGVFTLPIVLPLVLSAMTGAAGTGGASAALSPLVLLKQLCMMVLLPTLLGMTARASVPGLAGLVDGNKRAVVWLSSACLAVVPWMQVSRAVSSGLAIQGSQVALAFGMGMAVHLSFLLFNWTTVNAMNLGGNQPLVRAQLRQALVLQASQKTLPVAIAVVSEGAVAEQLGAAGAGLAAVGAVSGHLAQVLIDSLLVPSWTRYIQAAARAQQEQGEASM